MKALLTLGSTNQWGAGHLERQASIIADYWLLTVYGIRTWRDNQGKELMGNYRGIDHLKDVPALYEKIIYVRG